MKITQTHRCVSCLLYLQSSLITERAVLNSALNSTRCNIALMCGFTEETHIL